MVDCVDGLYVSMNVIGMWKQRQTMLDDCVVLWRRKVVLGGRGGGLLWAGGGGAWRLPLERGVVSLRH